MRKAKEKLLGLLLAAIMAVTTVCPSMTVFAEEGKIEANGQGKIYDMIGDMDQSTVEFTAGWSNEAKTEFYSTLWVDEVTRAPMKFSAFLNTYCRANFEGIFDDIPEDATITAMYEITLRDTEGTAAEHWDSVFTDTPITLSNGEEVRKEFNFSQTKFDASYGDWYVDRATLYFVSNKVCDISVRGLNVHIPQPGDFVYTTDFDWEDGMKLRDNPDLNNDPETWRGDMKYLYFGVLDDQLKFQPMELFKDDFEPADGVKFYYTPEGGERREATYSISFSVWDGTVPTDLKIHRSMDGIPNLYELALCRVGNFEIEYKGKSVFFRADPTPVDALEFDGYTDGVFYEDDASIHINMTEEVEEYSIAIGNSYGYGSDGNNYLVTATMDGQDITNKIAFVDVDNVNLWEDAAAYKSYVNGPMTLKMADFAKSFFYLGISFRLKNGEERHKVYELSYYQATVRSDNTINFNYKEDEPQAFQCLAISKEEYMENFTDFFIGWQLYASYGKTVQEAIDVMMAEFEKGTAVNRGYLQVRPWLAYDNKEEIALSKAPQYISTPDSIKGVLITSQELDFHVTIEVDGKQEEIWLNRSTPQGNPDGEVKYFYKPDSRGIDYYELVGDIATPEFKIKDGKKLSVIDENGDRYLLIDGVRYSVPDTVCVEYELPELHVDATNEIRLVGSFQKYDSDQPSIFMNIPEGSAINSYVNGDLYTSQDMGKTYNKKSVYHSWYSGDVTTDYTVKVDKLEAKTAFASSENSEVTSVTTAMDVDSLFTQITDGLLTDSEKSAVESGKNITVTLDVEAVDATASDALSGEIKNSYATSDLQYMDIDLLYHVGFDGAQDKNITETAKPVEISVALSKEFADADAEYVVLREHEGKVEELPATISADGIVTFKTDKFSSYAVVKKGEEPEQLPEAEQKVVDFTSRLYTVALGRDYDEKGLKDWSEKLLTHKVDAAGIAYGFIMSKEFQAKKLTDEEFIDVLYETFLGRKADAAGKKYWVAKLKAGESRGFILSGFVNSKEFGKIAEDSGIVAGFMRPDGTPVDAGVYTFVERLYTKTLGRQGDKAGIENWYNKLVHKKATPAQVAKAFVGTAEFKKINRSNEDLVEALYATFFDRKSDAAGKAYWVAKLEKKEMTVEQVVEGFAGSKEFSVLLKRFGF